MPNAVASDERCHVFSIEEGTCRSLPFLSGYTHRYEYWWNMLCSKWNYRYQSAMRLIPNWKHRRRWMRPLWRISSLWREGYILSTVFSPTSQYQRSTESKSLRGNQTTWKDSHFSKPQQKGLSWFKKKYLFQSERQVCQSRSNPAFSAHTWLPRTKLYSSSCTAHKYMTRWMPGHVLEPMHRSHLIRRRKPDA